MRVNFMVFASKNVPKKTKNKRHHLNGGTDGNVVKILVVEKRTKNKWTSFKKKLYYVDTQSLIIYWHAHNDILHSLPQAHKYERIKIDKINYDFCIYFKQIFGRWLLL